MNEQAEVLYILNRRTDDSETRVTRIVHND